MADGVEAAGFPEPELEPDPMFEPALVPMLVEPLPIGFEEDPELAPAPTLPLSPAVLGSPMVPLHPAIAAAARHPTRALQTRDRDMFLHILPTTLRAARLRVLQFVSVLAKNNGGKEGQRSCKNLSVSGLFFGH